MGQFDKTYTSVALVSEVENNSFTCKCFIKLRKSDASQTVNANRLAELRSSLLPSFA